MDPWNPQQNPDPTYTGGYPGQPQDYPGAPPPDYSSGGYPGYPGGATPPPWEQGGATPPPWEQGGTTPPPWDQQAGQGQWQQPGQYPGGGFPGQYGGPPGYGQPGYPTRPPKRTGLIVGLVIGAVVVIGGAAAGIGIAVSGKSGGASASPTNGATSTSTQGSSSAETYLSSFTVSSACSLVTTATLGTYVPDQHCTGQPTSGGHGDAIWQTNFGSSSTMNGYLDVEVDIDTSDTNADAISDAVSDYGISKKVDLEGIGTKIASSHAVTGAWNEGFIIDGTDTIWNGAKSELLVRWGNVTADISYTGWNAAPDSDNDTPIAQSQADAAVMAIAPEIRADLH